MAGEAGREGGGRRGARACHAHRPPTARAYPPPPASQECAAGDYEQWAAPKPDTCLLGAKHEMQRRRWDATCFNPPSYRATLNQTTLCACTKAADLECEYGYSPEKGGTCVKIDGLEASACPVSRTGRGGGAGARGCAGRSPAARDLHPATCAAAAAAAAVLEQQRLPHEQHRHAAGAWRRVHGYAGGGRRGRWLVRGPAARSTHARSPLPLPPPPPPPRADINKLIPDTDGKGGGAGGKGGGGKGGRGGGGGGHSAFKSVFLFILVAGILVTGAFVFWGRGGRVGGGARSVRLRPPPPAPACRAVAGVVWANCLPEGLKADIADRAAPVLGVLVGVFELVLDWVIAGWDWLRAKLGGEEGWVGARGRDGREKTRAAAGATRPAPPLSPPLLCRPAAAQRGGRGRLL